MRPRGGAGGGGDVAAGRQAGGSTLAGSNSSPSSSDSSCSVELCMLLSRRWASFTSWPPKDDARTLRLWLAGNDQLSWTPPPPSNASSGAGGGGSGTSPSRSRSYVYSPSEPTPACGGPSFNFLNSGERSQRPIERRDDVLVFTSPPLTQPLTIAGHVALKLRVACSAPSIDLVGRLCAVCPLAGSVNLCEGLQRVDADRKATGERASTHAQRATVGGEEGVDITVRLGPVAADFAVGSRVRLHVCSAAHPRWMRNLCDETSVPLAERRAGRPTRVKIWVAGGMEAAGAASGSSWLELPAIASPK